MQMLMQGGCAPSSLFPKPRLSNLDQHIFSHVLCLMPNIPALSLSEMTVTCQLSRCHLLELLPSTPETIVSFPLQYWSPVDRGHLRFLGPTHHQPRATTLAGLVLGPHDARCTTSMSSLLSIAVMHQSVVNCGRRMLSMSEVRCPCHSEQAQSRLGERWL
jgi:hypothetical protein